MHSCRKEPSRSGDRYRLCRGRGRGPSSRRRPRGPGGKAGSKPKPRPRVAAPTGRLSRAHKLSQFVGRPGAAADEWRTHSRGVRGMNRKNRCPKLGERCDIVIPAKQFSKVRDSPTSLQLDHPCPRAFPPDTLLGRRHRYGGVAFLDCTGLYGTAPKRVIPFRRCSASSTDRAANRG